jgi:hypothetical protein
MLTTGFTCLVPKESFKQSDKHARELIRNLQRNVLGSSPETRKVAMIVSMVDINGYDEGDASAVELHVGNPTRLWDGLEAEGDDSHVAPSFWLMHGPAQPSHSLAFAHTRH